MRTPRTPSDLHDLLLEFCHALCVVRKPEEAAHFLKDLLSKQEIMMLAKRLRIARLLIAGKTFDAIQRSLRVSTGTVARVSVWLQEAGEGYRIVVERTKDRPLERVDRDVATMEAGRKETSAWRRLQRKYPIYFWPQLLLHDIIESAPKRKRAKLLHALSILKESGHKTKLFRDLERILRNQ